MYKSIAERHEKKVGLETMGELRGSEWRGAVEGREREGGECGRFWVT